MLSYLLLWVVPLWLEWEMRRASRNASQSFTMAVSVSFPLGPHRPHILGSVSFPNSYRQVATCANGNAVVKGLWVHVCCRSYVYFILT